MSFERRLTYKVYQEDGTFIETLDDVVSDLTIKRQINGGDSEFVFELDRKMDDFDESNSVEFNNRVKVYLKDSYNTGGTKLVANGYIVSYRPFLQGKKEGVEVTCLSAVSKLSNDFYRTGTASASADLGVSFEEYTAGTAIFTNSSTTVTGTNTNWKSSFINRSIKNNVDGTLYEIDNVVSSTEITLKNGYTDTTTGSDPYTVVLPRVDEMMKAIINHYRSTETNSMISEDFINVEQTRDNDGTLFTSDHRFFNMKHLDAIRETSKLLARNKAGGYWYYWRINTNGDLVLKNVPSTADHTFHISRHIKEISGRKTIEGMINRVYFWNEKGPVDPDFLKLTSDDATSQTSHDIIAEYITDSKITNPNAAGLLADSKVYDKKDPKVRIEVTLNGEYDLSSIVPGQTCKILNTKNNPFKVGSDDILVIHSIEYSVDEAKLTLAEAADKFEEIVENERQRLDKEMTWFGFITQTLTAAQLGPANRNWSTDISFTATSGGDAYRQVDWSAGIVYIPTGSSGSSGKRVIVAGNTGLMTAATDYFIYLDEETFNTSAANSDSGASGIVREGDDALTDSSKSWTTNQYQGYILTIGGQTKIIKSNTATVLVIEDRWTITDQTSAYTIKKMTFETSTSKSDVSDLTKIVFSNVRANALTTSEAIITTTQGSSTAVNYNLDGSQIAKRSISANEIIANTITANEINTGAINIGDWSGDLDDVTDGSTYGKTTFNEVTGAGRGFSGLDTSNRISQGFLDSGLTSLSLPTNGIRIDSNGIYGRASGVTTFFISNAGSAFFAGEIGASSITGELNTDDYIRFKSGATEVGYVYASAVGNLLMSTTPSNITLQINGNGAASSIKFTIDTDFYFTCNGSAGYNIASKDIRPDTGTINLGSSSERWDYIYAEQGDFSDHLTVSGNAFLRIKSMTGATASGLSGAQNGATYYRSDDGHPRMYVNSTWHSVLTSYRAKLPVGTNMY